MKSRKASTYDWPLAFNQQTLNARTRTVADCSRSAEHISAARPIICHGFENNSRLKLALTDSTIRRQRRLPSRRNTLLRQEQLQVYSLPNLDPEDFEMSWFFDIKEWLLRSSSSRYLPFTRTQPLPMRVSENLSDIAESSVDPKVESCSPGEAKLFHL